MAKRRLTPEERERFRLERAEADRHIVQLRELAERGLAALPPEQRPDLPPYPTIPSGRRPTKAEREALRARMEANSNWLRKLAERGQAALDERRAS